MKHLSSRGRWSIKTKVFIDVTIPLPKPVWTSQAPTSALSLKGLSHSDLRPAWFCRTWTHYISSAIVYSSLSSPSSLQLHRPQMWFTSAKQLKILVFRLQLYRPLYQAGLCAWDDHRRDDPLIAGESQGAFGRAVASPFSHQPWQWPNCFTFT